jgi:hypothetical protein
VTTGVGGQYKKSVLRDFFGLIAGVLLHYLLIIAGSRLAWLLIVGGSDPAKIEYKEGVIRWMLWRTLAIDPAVAVVVGVFVAFVVRRSHWWFGGVATSPLLIYLWIRGADRIEIGSCVVYMVLAFGAAFVVSRFKRTGL